MFDSTRITPQWLAGFFDGEGSISGGFTKQSRSDGFYHKVPRLHVGLAQKNEPLLLEIRAIYGGSIRPQFTRGVISCYDLMWYGKGVLPLLRDIEPHVIVKREQVKLALRFMELVGSHGAQHPQTGTFRAMPSEWLEERSAIVVSLRDANRARLSVSKRNHYLRVDSTRECVPIN